MYLYTFLLAEVLLVHTELNEARRIVGGSNADISEYPHQILLRFRGKLHCGGSIYQPNIIITAAHCFDDSKNPADFIISAGYTLLSETKVSAKVKKIIIHEKYNDAITDYDIAILVLDRNLEYNSKVQPIRLHQESIPNGIRVKVTGWGLLSESGSNPDHLQQVEVELISNVQCKKDYRNTMYVITDSMLCARVKGGGKDACKGDSGGPLMFDGKLIGIVSWGYGCARKEFPGVYASVRVLYDWILETVENNTGSSA